MTTQNNAGIAEETVKPNNLTDHKHPEFCVFEFDDNYEGISGYSKPGWYFWADEHGEHLNGPFETAEKAEYAQDVLNAKI